MGAMDYRHFISFNVIGGTIWVALFLFLGYFFGTLPFVQAHFELVVVAIIGISIVPAIYEFWAERRRTRMSATAGAIANPES